MHNFIILFESNPILEKVRLFPKLGKTTTHVQYITLL